MTSSERRLLQGVDARLHHGEEGNHHGEYRDHVDVWEFQALRPHGDLGSLQGGGIVGVWLILFFGIFGYLAKKLDFSFVTFLIGFVVGPQFELSMRQAIAITPSFDDLMSHPIAIGFILITIIAVWKIGAKKKT